MSKTVDKEARLRRKLVNNELNPIADAILSIVLLCVTPLIWTFAQIHDKLMFKFLNKTYIYNVSWEVSETLITFAMACILPSFGYPTPPCQFLFCPMIIGFVFIPIFYIYIVAAVDFIIGSSHGPPRVQLD
jgi:hypothetical protein